MHQSNITGFSACQRGACAVMLLLGVHMAAQAQDAAPAGDDVRRVNINEFIVRGNTVLDNKTIEAAVYPHMGPQRTLEDIEAARDALQTVYHEHGYQSVYVDLPEQSVQGGVVILQVAETRVGRLKVVGARHYSPLAIRDEVPALREGEVPDFNAAQAQLTELNQTASRQVLPLVREGRIPGTMDVDLQVEDKRPWYVSAGLNNDYSADTRKLRAVLSVGHDNLWQRGHSVSLSFFTAPQEISKLKVFSGSYSLPLSRDWSLQVAGYSSDSKVATVGGTNVLGKGHSFGVAATYTVPGQGDWHHSLGIGADYKDFDETVRFGNVDDTVPLTYVPITLSYNGYRYADSAQSTLGLSLVTATRSMFGLNSDWRDFDYKRYLASPSFAVFKGDMTHNQGLGRDWQLYLRGSFQVASGALVSNEQFSAGGANSVRGYLAAEASADEGLLGSMELRTPSLGAWLGNAVTDWRWHVFAEWAGLRLRDPLPEQQRIFHLGSVGLGTRMQVMDWLSANLDWAYPLYAGSETRRYHPRLHFNLRANF
ncbi:hemolysin activation/secretion protein [Kerstersia gyiorum]|uniref:Hemolysin activation/secretion protein n=1 Tax=Kerstersia gyiorum TaxID=206506 RepID=A0A4Q7MPV6_9BURK|nr:ShlB/FhaC/HecB family hemolysin secretion/activation protein [Kerstersia gyiorum]RZS69688.1 hemolysin activation/secretion protein [Kerstersia gyiorum]